MAIEIVDWTGAAIDNTVGLQKGSISKKDMEILLEYAILVGISHEVFYLGLSFDDARQLSNYNERFTYWIDADFLEEVLTNGILDNNNDNKNKIQVYTTKQRFIRN